MKYPQPPPPAPAEAIRRAESQLGIALPASIVRLLRESNGRVIDDTRVTHEEWTVLPVRDHSSRRRRTATAEDVVWHTQRARADGDVPADAVVVARAWTAWNRLIVLPDVADPRRLGDALYRQVGMGDPVEVAASIEDLRRAPTASLLDVEALPRYRFHPDPVRTGSIAASPGVCPSCGARRDFAYRGAVHTATDAADLCPWCIADGSAADTQGVVTRRSSNQTVCPPGPADEDK